MTGLVVRETLQQALQHRQAGRWPQAGALYREVLAHDPDCVDAVYHLGVIALQTGHPAVAAEMLGHAVILAPANPAIHFDLGEAYRQMQHLDDAVASLTRALDLRPAYPEASYNLGRALDSLGRRDEAIACFRQALAFQPNAAGAHYHLGAALAEKGMMEEAMECLQRAIAIKPDLAEAHHLLGKLFQGTGQLADAATSYRHVLMLRPDSAITHSNLGAVLNETGFVDEAIASLQRAIALQPDLAAAYNNLGIIFRNRGQLDDASSSFQQALVLQPDLAATHNNLGLVFKDQGRWDDALACFQQARALQPNLADAHHNIGLVCKERGRLDEALACYRQALALQPDFAAACNNLGNVLKDTGRLDEALASYRRAFELDPDLIEAHSNFVYTRSFQPGIDAIAIKEDGRIWEQQHAAPLLRFVQPHSNDRSPGRRLRIGYVSPDFNDHCQAFFMVPLLEAHDHAQFEIHAYASVRSADAVTGRIRRAVDGWHDVLRLTDAQLAEKIRADGIDIIVDLTMHMAHHRLLAFARKPAPVQIAWLAYPGTTGMSTIDYRLTDPCLDPPRRFDACYAEESIRLPDTFWCYDPLTNEPAVNPLPATATDCITFGCLNNFCKVNPDVLGLWAKVLQAVPNSRLLLLCPEGRHRQPTLELLSTQGVQSNRVEFLAPRPRLRYLELYHRIDLCLDTFPYNGHTTSLDSYWMGVPVVTLVGQTVVGRAGWSQLSNLGLAELAGHTPDEFAQIAVRLAGDLPRLAALRATLRGRMQRSPLMDAPRFAAAVEATYRTLWQRWCATDDAAASRS